MTRFLSSRSEKGMGVFLSFSLIQEVASIRTTLLTALKRAVVGLAVLLLLAAATPVGAATVFSVVDDFSTTTNTETSTWSYRSSTDLVHNGSYALLPTYGPQPSCCLWTGMSYWHGSGPIPGIGVNETGGTFNWLSVSWPNNTVGMHPDSFGLTAVSWLSPGTGTIDINFTFGDMDPGACCGDPGGIRWYVDRNTTTLASGSIPNGGPSISISLNEVAVSTGNRIYFIVDAGSVGNNTFDSTSLTATITFTPELFAAFDAKVEITLGPLANDDEFEVKATFTLGTGSDGIDPVTEDVSFQVGTFSTTIPAGSFKFHPANSGKGKGKGAPARWTFEGVIDGVELEAKITDLGGGGFEFKAEGASADLTGTVNPVTVGLTIGDDGGSTTVEAEFE